MFNTIGYSVYLSNFKQIRDQLSSLSKEGNWIFTSFHISEEVDDTYVSLAKNMCHELKEMGYQILADVSKKTLMMFGCTDIISFAEDMGISILRIDYGFTEDEMIEIARKIPICLNASTVRWESAKRIVAQGAKVYAMHNFYPRPETGLDETFFDELNQKLTELGIEVLSFVPGDKILRGPIFEGLPTLEEHRGQSPYAAYIDMMLGHKIDDIFVGDGIISEREARMLDTYKQEGIISLPIDFLEPGKKLYNQIFTIRVDSPKWLKRLQESREYSCFGEVIQPFNNIERTRGSVTVDNIKYQRYSGEVQIIIEDLPKDERVNVLGVIPLKYQLLLKNIKNGQKIIFIRNED